MKTFDFLPDLMANDPEYKPREDVKPLHVVQPEGVSFKIDGHELEWQKWKMHIGSADLYHDRAKFARLIVARSFQSQGRDRAVNHHL
jgi:Cu2+-containing amine oxidase